MKVEKGVGREGRKKIGGKEGDNFMFPVTLSATPSLLSCEEFCKREATEKQMWEKGSGEKARYMRGF